MSKVAHRKKPITIDGAEFVIAPLTYSEVEKYGEDSFAFAQKRKDAADAKKYSIAEMKELRDLSLWVVACSLNNADPAISDARQSLADGVMTQEKYDESVRPLEMTVAKLLGLIDDTLAAAIFREVMVFTGLRVPSVEEAQAATGELTASS